MSVPQSQLAPWTRKHDKPGVPLVPQAPVILFPQSLEDLIQICSTRAPGSAFGPRAGRGQSLGAVDCCRQRPRLFTGLIVPVFTGVVLALTIKNFRSHGKPTAAH